MVLLARPNNIKWLNQESTQQRERVLPWTKLARPFAKFKWQGNP